MNPNVVLYDVTFCVVFQLFWLQQKVQVHQYQVFKIINYLNTKHSVKDKSITEDQERKAIDKIQTITNEYTKSIEEIVKEKEKDLLEV